MAMMPVSQVLVILFIIAVVGGLWLLEGEGLRRLWIAYREKHRQTRGPRTLRARTPADCERCQGENEVEAATAGQAVRAWRATKGRAGRPKTSESSGLSCPNPRCAYYQETDANRHAVVRDGWRGKGKDIAYWRCQACGRSFSGRYGSALYHLKTRPARVAEVMTALGEGVDIAAASRIFGHHPTTISRWLKRGATQGQRLHEHYFQKVRAWHIQLDELVTRVRSHTDRVWVWTAIEAQTKLLLAVHIGRRTQQDAHSLVHAVKARLNPDCVPIFTSDGLNQYFYALTAHFGQWLQTSDKRQPIWQVAPALLYGQLRKVRSGYKVKYTYNKVLLGKRALLTQSLQALALSGRIHTAFVERLNLTLRELIAPLSRRTWSLAYHEASLALCVEWGRTYYHFARYHQSLRFQLPSGRYRSRTPAMAAGLTRKRWTVRELLELTLPA